MSEGARRWAPPASVLTTASFPTARPGGGTVDAVGLNPTAFKAWGFESLPGHGRGLPPPRTPSCPEMRLLP
jgi:hypothetical protein